MLKRRYMIIIALVTVSILVGSLFYSNIVSGASSSSSGSWGIIRFFTPNETYANQYNVWIEAATFTYIPQNTTNNAILHIHTYYQYNCDGSFAFRIRCNGFESYPYWHVDQRPSPGYVQTPIWSVPTAWESGNNIQAPEINQPSYTLRFEVRPGAGNLEIYVKNINIILTVANGIIPNEYYKVELPSEAVGGLWIPVDKFSLLAPYVALVLTIILAVSMSVAYVKHRKKQ